LGWTAEIVYTEAGPTRTMAPRPRETTRELPLPEVNTDWCDFYKNVVATIRGNASLIVTPEEEIRLMHVVDLLFESARQGRSIKCRL
ncbi:MAG: gfo/Idh/MocA family oxidoreductase, partial [Clostridia bacterium]|nr:gfo/Idh/MocA family oxidoreductase [Clostridia bacterium]